MGTALPGTDCCNMCIGHAQSSCNHSPTTSFQILGGSDQVCRRGKQGSCVSGVTREVDVDKYKSKPPAERFRCRPTVFQLPTCIPVAIVSHVEF